MEFQFSLTRLPASCWRAFVFGRRKTAGQIFEFKSEPWTRGADGRGSFFASLIRLRLTSSSEHS